MRVGYLRPVFLVRFASLLFLMEPRLRDPVGKTQIGVFPTLLRSYGSGIFQPYCAVVTLGFSKKSRLIKSFNSRLKKSFMSRLRVS